MYSTYCPGVLKLADKLEIIGEVVLSITPLVVFKLLKFEEGVTAFSTKLSLSVENLTTNALSLGLIFALEEIFKTVLSEFPMQLLDTQAVEYKCDCSTERVTRALISAGEEGLREMAEDEQTEVCCHFCNKKYNFSEEELKQIYNTMKM